MDRDSLYSKALRLESDRIKKAIDEELGIRPPSSEEEWERILATRDTAEIQKLIEYLLGGKEENR